VVDEGIKVWFFLIQGLVFLFVLLVCDLGVFGCVFQFEEE
jgi:hypothetical protein